MSTRRVAAAAAGAQGGPGWRRSRHSGDDLVAHRVSPGGGKPGRQERRRQDRAPGRVMATTTAAAIGAKESLDDGMAGGKSDRERPGGERSRGGHEDEGKGAPHRLDLERDPPEREQEGRARRSREW